jgi:ATPase subunit of ABC transporter with duplicated ATPase domains
MKNNQHSPINISNFTISYTGKICIDKPFTANIYYGDKIAIIGRNGTGKSSLLSCLARLNTSYDGSLIIPQDIVCGYVPQIINDQSYYALNDQLSVNKIYHSLSGGQRFNKALNQALSSHPNVLLLDEPTNHLDAHNKRSLIKFLKKYQGTVIAVTHDEELLQIFDIIWHVYNNKVTVFNGGYTNFLASHQHKQDHLQTSLKELKKEQRSLHTKLMQEQSRAKHSKLKGQNDIKHHKYATVTSLTKAGRGITTAVDKNKQLSEKRQDVISGLSDIFIPEELIPRFNLSSQSSSSTACLVNIINGSIGYKTDQTFQPLLSDINFSLAGNEKILLQGDNGSGKTTFIKAILSNNNESQSFNNSPNFKDTALVRAGSWEVVDNINIGYLDQHYANLIPDLTAVELMQQYAPKMTMPEIRDHLNSYLLRKNEEVNLSVKYLSGGEKVRLSLALIAAQIPKLLILDEITNNVDLETKHHLQNILRSYPSSYILICHDGTFCEELELTSQYIVENGTIIRY